MTESIVEAGRPGLALGAGLCIAHGPEIVDSERGGDYGRVVLEDRLRQALVPQSEGAGQCPLGGVPQADTARFAVAGRGQPRHAPLARRGRAGRVPAQRQLARRRHRAGDRLRRPRQQRLPGRQPTHRRREQARTPAGRGAVRQRPAAGGDRTQERRRRERDHLGRVQPVADVQAADPDAVHLERGPGDLGRRAGADRHADRRPRTVHAVADHRGRRPGPAVDARIAGGAGGGVREDAGSCNWSGISSSSRTRAAASSSRRWPGITSSTR
jgi:hypothetical protein